PSAAGVYTAPSSGSQESIVQGLSSLTSTGLPGVHTPPRQISTPLHTLPSLHGVPSATGVYTAPSCGSQESIVQGLASSTSTGLPGVHTPSRQVSTPLHGLPSLQSRTPPHTEPSARTVSKRSSNPASAGARRTGRQY